MLPCCRVICWPRALVNGTKAIVILSMLVQLAPRAMMSRLSFRPPTKVSRLSFSDQRGVARTFAPGHNHIKQMS